VQTFADLCGDHNPVHLDAAFAATTRFGAPIAHGMLYGSLIGTIFGASVPGSIYVSQTFKFKKPVYVGEPVVARVEVVEVRAAPHIATCATTVRKADGSIACEGQAVVLLPPRPGTRKERAGSGASAEMR
jgi:acyl dehydratase